MLSSLIKLRGDRRRLQDQIEQIAKIAATTPQGSARHASQIVTLTKLRDALAGLDARIARLESQRRAP